MNALALIFRHGVSLVALASLFVVFGFVTEVHGATVYETPIPSASQIMEDETFIYAVPSGVVWDRVQVAGLPFTINRAVDVDGASSCSQVTTTDPDGYTTLVCTPDFTSDGSVELTFSYGATSSIRVFNSGGSYVPWARFCLDSCDENGFPAMIDGVNYDFNYNTRFLGFTASGTSGNIELSADYFIDGSEIQSNVSAYNPTIVKFRYANRASSTSEFGGQGETMTDFDGNASISTTLVGLSDGVYDVNIYFTNFGCETEQSECPFALSYIYSEFTVSSGTVSSVGNIELYDGTTIEQEVRYKECSITKIDNCISNAFVFLFVPNDLSMDYVGFMYDFIKEKAPFAYLDVFYGSIQAMRQTGGTLPTVTIDAGGLGEMTIFSGNVVESGGILGTAAATLRYGFMGFIWLAVTVYYYRRSRAFIHKMATT